MVNVLVTGANGLLATNTIKLLLEKGFIVKALLRNKEKFIAPNHKNLTLIEGDVTKIQSLKKHFLGCDVVIHAAANTSQNLLHLSDYYPVNVQGTKNVIECCKINEIKKLIYIGTANSFGHGSLENLGNESLNQKSPFDKSYYAISKLKSQVLINNTKGIDIISICPTFMIGAYDAKPSSGKIIFLANKRIVFYPPGGKNFIHVKDVATAILNAINFGKPGENYILGNENMSYKAFFDLTNKLTNRSPVMIRLPKSILKIMGQFGNIIRWFGFPVNLSSVNIDLLNVKSYYSNKKAKDELKMNFSSMDLAISDAINWFKKEGLFK